MPRAPRWAAGPEVAAGPSVAELERDNARLVRRLKQAEAIIDAQETLSELLGLSAPPPGEAGSIG
jgi:hypothetical protein